MQPPATDWHVRPARNTDSPGIIALIGRCFRDYPGCLLDVNREETGLLDPEGAFDAFWVVEHRDRIVGTIGCAAHGTTVELKKLYLHPRVRGTGLARRLVELVEDWARRRGAERIELWSDDRFDRAHAVYVKFGYTELADTRALHDISDTVELHFEKRLDGG